MKETFNKVKEIFKGTTKKEISDFEKLANNINKLNSGDSDESKASIKDQKYQDEINEMGINMKMPEPSKKEAQHGKSIFVDGKQQIIDKYNMLEEKFLMLEDKKLHSGLTDDEEEEYRRVSKLIDEKFGPQLEELDERAKLN